jgi:hypothetical protein
MPVRKAAASCVAVPAPRPWRTEGEGLDEVACRALSAFVSAPQVLLDSGVGGAGVDEGQATRSWHDVVLLQDRSRNIQETRPRLVRPSYQLEHLAAVCCTSADLLVGILGTLLSLWVLSALRPDAHSVSCVQFLLLLFFVCELCPLRKSPRSQSNPTTP